MLSFSKLKAVKRIITIQRPQILAASSHRHFHGPPKKEEFSKVAEYPQIETYKNEDEKEFDQLRQTIKSLNTVEEKQMYLNKPKYYGWYSCVVDTTHIKADSLDFLRFVTNTAMIDDSLPAKFSDLDDLAAREAEILEPIVKRHLALQHCQELSHDVADDKVKYQEGHSIFDETFRPQRRRIDHNVNGLHRLLQCHLGQRHPHLLGLPTDHNSRIEAFWMKSGIKPDLKMLKKRKGRKEKLDNDGYPDGLRKDDAFVQQTYDRCIQIVGKNVAQMRSEAMLDSFIDIQDEICQTGAIPPWNYSLKLSGYPNYNQNGTNIPGNWTGQSAPFVNLSFVSSLNEDDGRTNATRWKLDSKYNDREEMLTSKAVTSSYGVLLPTACYLGFDPMNDPTRPLSTNTIVSDGKLFKFSSYQLNKTALVHCDAKTKLDEEYSETVPRNVCWHLPEQQLYSGIEESTGQVVDFDKDVLATLIKFYLMKPTIKSEDFDNNEFLSEKKFMHNLNNDYNRNYGFKTHRHMYSKRPRHYAKPEIETWEQIYRVRHPEQTHTLGNRERPWYNMAKYDYLGKHHWHPEFRQFDYYMPAYNPAKFRPKGKKGFGRVKKVFAPIPDDVE